MKERTALTISGIGAGAAVVGAIAAIIAAVLAYQQTYTEEYTGTIDTYSAENGQAEDFAEFMESNLGNRVWLDVGFDLSKNMPTGYSLLDMYEHCDNYIYRDKTSNLVRAYIPILQSSHTAHPTCDTYLSVSDALFVQWPHDPEQAPQELRVQGHFAVNRIRQEHPGPVRGWTYVLTQK